MVYERYRYYFNADIYLKFDIVPNNNNNNI